jgi:hypothetical protein
VNSFVENEYGAIEETQSLIGELLDEVPESAFDFSPGGSNPTIRGLLKELAQTEIAYAQSFHDWTMNFEYGSESPIDLRSVDTIRAGFTRLHQELKTALATVSEADLTGKLIDRGGGFRISPRGQIHIYGEAVLIVASRISVYLRALELPLPGKWEIWIG